MAVTILVIFLALLMLAVLAVAVGVKTFNEAKQVVSLEQSAVASLQSVRGSLTSDLGTGSGSGASASASSSRGFVIPAANTASSVSRALRTAQAETRQANEITHRWNWALLTYLPKYGGDITTVRGLTDAAATLAGNVLPDYASAYSSLMNISFKDASGNGLDLRPVVDLRPTLTKANSKLQQVARNVSALPKGSIGMVRTARGKVADAVVPAARQSQTLTDILDVLSRLIGSSKISTYVVANVTPAEIGTGGGLVGSLGSIQLGNGKISIGNFESNTDMLRNLGSGHKTVSDLGNAQKIFNTPVAYFSFDVRDANLDPDFRNVATNMIGSWNSSRFGASQPGVGMIQVDPAFVQYLISLTGAVKLPNGVSLDASNTARYLENTLYKQVTDPRTQNDYFGVITQTAIGNFTSNLSARSLLRLTRRLPDLAAQRHICAYSQDARTQKAIDRMGLTPRPQVDATRPRLGVYTTVKPGSKMAFYEKRDVSVRQTSGPTADGARGRRTYTVTYTATNTLTTAEGKTLPFYITGNGLNQQDHVLIYAPKGGSVSGIKADQLRMPIRSHTWNGNNLSVAYSELQPGQAQTITMTVATSPNATTGLTVDRTPSC